MARFLRVRRGGRLPESDPPAITRPPVEKIRRLKQKQSRVNMKATAAAFLVGLAGAQAALPPNQLLGSCLTDAWVGETEASLGLSAADRDDSGRLANPFLHAALRHPRYSVRASALSALRPKAKGLLAGGRPSHGIEKGVFGRVHGRRYEILRSWSDFDRTSSRNASDGLDGLGHARARDARVFNTGARDRRVPSLHVHWRYIPHDSSEDVVGTRRFMHSHAHQYGSVGCRQRRRSG